MQIYDRSTAGRWTILFIACVCGWLGFNSVVGEVVVASTEVTTFHQFYAISPERALKGAPVRIEGIIVCYDTGWNQLYIYDGTETAWFSPQLFQTNLQVGLKVEIAGSTTFGQGSAAFTNLQLKVLGPTTLPPAKHLTISQLGSEFGQWIETRGRIRVAETSPGRLSLVIEDKGQTCLVYVMGLINTNDFKWMLGCNARISGINASKATAGRLESASIYAAGLNLVEIIDRPATSPHDIPVTSVDALLNRELGSWTNEPVRLNGLIDSYKPGESLMVKDATGSIRAQVIQTTLAQNEERVDVWGYLTVLPGQIILRDAYFEIQQPRISNVLPVTEIKPIAEFTNHGQEITDYSKISEMRPGEAARGFPVRLSGTVTYADSDWGNCFIQNRNGAIYVDLKQRDIAAGQWVEVTGRTSPGGFAPEVTNSTFRILGMTNLPTPVKADLEDLANGHLDSHWVQLEGVVRQVTEQWGHVTLALTTPKGRFKAVVLKSDQPLPANLIDALVSVQGACTSEMNDRGQLTGIRLRVPGFAQIGILEAAPSDPFALRSTAIRSVAVFDPNRLAGRRVKISGTVTLVSAGRGFYVQDDSGGMRVNFTETNNLQAGDTVNVLGFPSMGDFSPCLEEVIFQRTGSAPLPTPSLTTAEKILLEGTNDASLVQIEARLVQRVARSAHPKLVLQSGSIIFTAQLVNPSTDSSKLDFQTGSLLRLVGVCSIQGGDRHEAEIFHLQVVKPQDIVLLSTPPWWTIRHTLMLISGLAIGVLLAWAWSGSLRRQVHEQTEVIRRNHEELMTVSRQAGMAEVAISVLHNVGNVLNSVNVSADLAADRLRMSRTVDVSKIATMMSDHAADLGEFMTQDSKGRQLPDYLIKLGEHLSQENRSVLGELETLKTNIQHIKDIVETQQNYAKVGGFSQTVKVADLIEDALRMNQDALERHDIHLSREYDAPQSSEITVEKHKVLQILVNLISNAKNACSESGQTEKRLTIRVSNGDDRIRIALVDNGVGIPGENLTRIFTYGFTTRKHGHGFGLHSAALAAQEMGGTLLVHSEGVGCGATFTLELPRTPKQS